MPGPIRIVNPPENMLREIVPEQIIGRNFQVAIEFGLEVPEDQENDEETEISCVMSDREFALKHVRFFFKWKALKNFLVNFIFQGFRFEEAIAGTTRNEDDEDDIEENEEEDEEEIKEEEEEAKDDLSEEISSGSIKLFCKEMDKSINDMPLPVIVKNYLMFRN